MKQKLETFFKPKSIAVIGASRSTTKIGHTALKNILISDYECELYPINPKEKEILGLKCYRKITDVPEGVDLALHDLRDSRSARRWHSAVRDRSAPRVAEPGGHDLLPYRSCRADVPEDGR